MGIGGSSAAGLLLLLFCLAAESSTINGKIARRATPSSTKQTAFLDATEINRETLSIAESRNAILRRSNAGRKLDQSKISMVNAEDVKDLENLEHVLSVVGYEPQKIANANTLNVVQDSDRKVASSPRESADPTADVNHEVPRTVQPSRIATIPQRSSRSKQNTQKVLAIDSKPKSPIEASLFRPRSPLNLSSTAPTRDETKLAPLHGVYSITAPSNDDTYSRKRNRKRVTTRRDEESASSSTENYPRQFPKVRGSANKSGRLSSRTKLAFRPFAGNFVESRKGNLEKLVDKEVTLNGIRNVRGKNIQENAARTGHGNTLEGAGSSGKLHERKDTGASPANVEDDSLSADLRESDDKTCKSDGDDAYKNSEMSEESGSSKEDVASSTNTNGSDLDNSLKEMVATSSSFEPHRDVKIPAVAEHSPRSSNYVHRSSSSSSTVDPPATSTDSWTNEPEQRNAKTQSDGVAEATSVENGEEDEKYERHEDRQVDNHDLPSHEYIHENERAPEGVKDDVNASFKKDEDGRHAEKYDVRVKGDVASDGSHDTESHRGAKEGAAVRGKFEKGEATERKQEHRETDGEKGEKGYESWHEEEKANKGHHDKEQRSNYYDEKDGKKKEENEEGGYHEERQEGEKGEKKAEFDDKGEHQKGYNTKGQHLVHKKDEFEKRTEFFDEFHEDGDAENDGEFYHKRKMSKGGDYKAGHHNADDHEQTFGKKSEYEKSGHHRDNKGHEVKGGEDSHHEQENMHGEEKSHRGGKKWTYKNGADEADKKGH